MRFFRYLVLLLFVIPAVVVAEMPVAIGLDRLQDSSYVSNSVIDVFPHNNGIWLATGKGLNVTYDEGDSWLVFDGGNGLVSENVSAAFSMGDRLWAGTSHYEMIDGVNFSISDGVSYSDDNGQSWTQIDFSSTGLDIDWIWGGNQTIYDITGWADTEREIDWMFFSAFAGSLLASQDGGMNWRRMYASTADSIQFNDANQQPSLSNRSFSCAIDTSHSDSVFLWAGTAAGIFQYVFAPPENKFYSENVFAIAYCDTCTDSVGSFVYFGGEHGVTRGSRTGAGLITRMPDDPLLGTRITAITVLDDRLLVGTQDTLTGNSTGLAFSTDNGESFSSVTFPGDDVDDSHVEEFARIGSRVYMAASQAGLLASEDSGSTWSRIYYDSVNTAALCNTANGLATIGDSLLVGTDSGLVIMAFDGAGEILEQRFLPFEDDVWSGSKVHRVRVQQFETDGVIDSTAVWTVQREMTLVGSPVVRRSNDLNDPSKWAPSIPDTLSYDVAFYGDTAFVVGEAGIRYTATGGSPNIRYLVADSVNSGIGMVLDSAHYDTVYAAKVLGDTIYFGSNHGMAISPNAGESFAVRRGNTDSLKADVVINHTRANSIFIDSELVYLGLTGDFIPAIGLQPQSEGPDRIWASCRSAGSGFSGIAVGAYVPKLDTLGDSIGVKMRWRALYGEDFAWNFAFYGDTTVYAATGSGVLVNYGDSSVVWDTLLMVDSDGRELLQPGTPAYGLEIKDDYLWIGTADGTVKMSLDDPSDKVLYQVVDLTSDADEVYAFPTPFAPNRGGECRFRYVLEEDANVTIEVYDFAMNLVARPLDNAFFPAGVYPNSDYRRVAWDGYNGNGDPVAVGVYYFKVELSTGDVRWGKLAVIP